MNSTSDPQTDGGRIGKIVPPHLFFEATFGGQNASGSFFNDVATKVTHHAERGSRKGGPVYP